MSDMVERVARAICEREGYDIESLKAGKYGEHANTWQDFLDDARVAINAMREPTEAMANEGHGGNPVKSYQAMIDAALGTVEGDR